MMNYDVLIEPEADQDVSSAFSWYEEQREGLGREFLISLDAVFRRLQQSPEIHAKTYKETRQTLLRRFPYIVCYVLEENYVSVIAVFHAHRDPQAWKERLT